MKKALLFLSIFLLVIATALAQTMPQISTAESESWYFIRFKNGANVIQDMGQNQKLITKKALQDEAGQLWKLESAANNKYIISSKLGNKISFSTSFSRFITSATATNLVLKKSTVSGYTPAWEIGRTTAQTMNQHGGTSVGVEIGEWGSDVNNPLEFVNISEMGFPPLRLAEVPLKGKANAPEQKLALWYRFPSTNWMTSSLPIGNGEFGAMVFGGVKQDEIQFNDKTLWTGGPLKYGAYQNFGNLYINNNNVEEAVNYRRELDIENAISRVSYTNKGVDFLREYFTSNPDSAVVIRLTASESKQISIDLLLWDAHNALPVYEGNSVTIAGKLDLVSYYAKVQVINEGGVVSASGRGINVDKADAVTIILRGKTDYNPYSLSYISNTQGLPARVDNIINRAAAQSYDELKSRHIADYKSLFDRLSLDFAGTCNSIPTDVLAKNYNASVAAGGKGYPFLEMLYFQFGRYLMISSSRGVDLPSNLQGVWNHKNNPPWSSDIHANINVQMNYWPAENTNLSELHKPFLNYIYNEAMNHPQWSLNALNSKKTLAGNLGLPTPSSAKGWTLYTENNIFGFGSTFAMNYVVANSWFCMHSWQHYRYTQDEDFLLTNAYPLMKSTSEFWLERLIEDRGKTKGPNILKTYLPDGTLVAPLEYSAEHGPGEEDGTAHAQQLIWDLFNNTLQAMDVLGAKVASDATFKNQLEAAFAKLDPGLAIDKDGHLREWKYSEKEAGQKGHRHTSHLMGLYPGNQISPKIDKSIFDAAIKSLDARGDEGTGWSMGWRINLWARSGDGERAHKLIRGALNLTYDTGNGGGWGGGIYENLLDTHTPFQIDGNFGATAGIAEMLLQSHTDTIDILPTLPTVWMTGKVKGLRAIGNFEVDIDWENMRATKIRIQSFKGRECRVSYPFIKNAVFKDENGAIFSPTLVGSNLAIFSTVEGASYSIVFESSSANAEVSIGSVVNTNAETQAKMIQVSIGDKVVLKSNPKVAGNSYWTGPDALSSTEANVVMNAIQTYKSGMYYLAFVGTEGRVSKDSIEVRVDGVGPFTKVIVPGVFQAEDYNYGGENVAFHALDAVNDGASYRTDGIDVYTTSNRVYAGLKAGEWTKYTVLASRAGNFRVSASLRATAAKSGLELFVNDVLVSELMLDAPSSDFNDYNLDRLIALGVGEQTIKIKAKGAIDLDYVSLEHFYETNTLTDGLYYFRVEDKNWTYLASPTNKTKPTFQAITNNENQQWRIVKDGSRYKMSTKSDERYINEQNTFGTNDYSAAWNTFNIYFDGEKYAFQNAGNSGSDYWRFFGGNVSKRSDPGYPVNFEFELIPVSPTNIDGQLADSFRIVQHADALEVITSSDMYELRLTSVSGLLVAYTQTNKINTAALPKGVYVLSVNLKGGVASNMKIVLQ